MIPRTSLVLAKTLVGKKEPTPSLRPARSAVLVSLDKAIFVRDGMTGTSRAGMTPANMLHITCTVHRSQQIFTV